MFLFVLLLIACCVGFSCCFPAVLDVVFSVVVACLLFCLLLFSMCLFMLFCVSAVLCGVVECWAFYVMFRCPVLR